MIEGASVGVSQTEALGLEIVAIMQMSSGVWPCKGKVGTLGGAPNQSSIQVDVYVIRVSILPAMFDVICLYGRAGV